MKTFSTTVTAALAMTALVNLAGCATAKSPNDPLEPLNRKIYGFNHQFDRFIARPIAKTYDTITPNFIQARVTNFFNNVDLMPSTANDLLQLNIYQTCMDGSRFVVNSTVGLLGLFDVASKINLPDHHNDVGLTLARWGMKSSPYFVIPFLGPSTIRDAISIVPNTYITPWPYINPLWISYTAGGVFFIDKRAQLLPTDKLVEDAFDPYVFVRDAYLQYRQNQVNGVLGLVTTITANDTDSGDTYIAPSAGESSTITPAVTTTTTTDTSSTANPTSTNNPHYIVGRKIPDASQPDATLSVPTAKPKANQPAY